ncbi:hypothetical protein R6Z07M_013945 [Ovis aries]
MGQGEVGRCSGANSCRRLVAVWLFGVQWAGGQGQDPQTLLCPPHSLWGRRWCVGRRCWAVLGALGLLAGAGFGSWLLVLYLWPAASQPTPGALQDEMTLNCSEASSEEALLPSIPRTVSFRINTSEDFLLELRLRARPGWLLVCYESWSSALGARVCGSLGHRRLTHHKAVNLSDIRLNSSKEFAQLSPRLEGFLEEVWQPRSSLSSALVSPLQGLGRRRWEKEVSLMPLGWKSPGGRLTWVRGDVFAASVCSFRLSCLSSWRVHAGLVSHRTVRPHQGAVVERIITRPLYSAQNHDYDVALLGAQDHCLSAHTVGAVCLLAKERDFLRGSECWVSGWGHTDPSHTHSSVLQDSALVYSGALTPHMLCADYLDGRADGVSGGPLVCLDEGMWRLVGVVSWGHGCAEPSHSGVYTKVPKFLDSIQDAAAQDSLPHSY